MTSNVKDPAATPSGKTLDDLDRRLIETAARLFSEQGYAETSVDQIAQATSAGKQSIYRRYPTKEHLFKAVVSEQMLKPLADGWEERLNAITRHAESQASDPLDVLRLTCHSIFDYLLTPHAIQLQRILMAEGWRFPEWAAELERFSRAFESTMTRYLSAARDAGKIPPYHPRYTEIALIGMLTGLARRCETFPGLAKPAKPAELEAFFDCAWNLFLNGVKGSANG